MILETSTGWTTSVETGSRAVLVMETASGLSIVLTTDTKES